MNCRIWGSENPKMIIEKLLSPECITVGWGFCAGGIIETYFFENEAGVAISVNGLRYRGQNWKIWMWTMFICNKTALRDIQVAKSTVFCVKSFQVEWFLEMAITIGCRDHAPLSQFKNSKRKKEKKKSWVKNKIY